ncbi:MAG: NAD(P)/FAD-dependent oxidoreductase [Planctomycetaceae bacterium]|nr:NAD(P)/FAD-dependent oxidoreductase [Planctomycetaceae bacterium]
MTAADDARTWDAIIIGAGAAGMMAAAHAAELGHRVLSLEKNRKVGAKILMSGGTRCNLTQATDKRGIVAAFGESGAFLHSALARLSPEDVVGWFETMGVPTKVEETGKIFPASDSAVDVQQALLRAVIESGVTLLTETGVESVQKRGEEFCVITSRGEYLGRQVMLTTGGRSYPGCGTTGDGYAWASALGHTIVRPRPALVPLTAPKGWWTELSGLTLPDVVLKVVGGGEKVKLAEDRGSFLFTHFGYSGPSVLNVSRAVTQHSGDPSVHLVADWLPQLTSDQLSGEFQQLAQKSGGKQMKSRLGELLPKRLVESLMEQGRIPGERTFAEFSRAEQQRMIGALKESPLPISGTRGFEKAEVTAGGVSLDEVDSRTLESKLVPGLFLAGEILDLDGKIGGYNFQAAFSTGWLAAESLRYPDG